MVLIAIGIIGFISDWALIRYYWNF